MLEVYKTGSLREAAQNLSLTESAASKTLKELEAELGVALFLRSKLGTTPTDAGRRFAGYAANAVESLRIGASMARPMRHPSTWRCA
jgi:DNA-binding transcriptional LysR family regulator